MSDARQTALSGRRAAAWLALLAAALLTGAAFANSASAGSYSVYSCVGPSGESMPNNAWVQSRSVPDHTSAVTFGNNCPDLSVVATPGTTLAAGEDAGYSFTAPPGTTIAGYNVRRSITVAFPASGALPTLSAGLRRTSANGETYLLECEARTTNCSVPASGTQSANLVASSLQLGVECAQGSSCAGAGFTTLRSTLLESRVDLADNSAPAITITGGTLPGATGNVGARGLDVAISDLGGGIKSYWIAIDGVKKNVVNSGGTCDQVYTGVVPCPSTRYLSYLVDLASYAPGSHTAVVTAVDAAGNVGTLSPITFTIPGLSNGVVANGSPSIGAPILSVRKGVFDGKGSSAVTVRGVLKTSSGAVIAGATLDVSASSIGVPGAATTVLGTTESGEDGSFAFKVKPRGARRITFSYRPSSGSASTAEVSAIVRQQLSISAKRSRAVLSRGKALTISGRLTGAAGAAAGAPVEIQVLNGKSWATIAKVRASKSGAYKWKYRFKRVTRPTLFRFRAVVRSNQSWPWPTRSSNSIQVLVTG